MSDEVTIFEVGPRDGLQNESRQLGIETKVELINLLNKTGLKKIEVGSFVSPKWVPQMANSADVFGAIDRQDDIRYAALTPNLKGFEDALNAKADEVAIFAAASEGFSQKNINCSIKESIERFKLVAEQAQQSGLPLRGYVSCIAACPYDGATLPRQVAQVCQQLFDLGCYEVSLGDTIGVATPKQIRELLAALLTEFKPQQLALHCHDTYGQALANINTGLELGIRTFDSSVAGLGGCPYAQGASGNVATEDLIYLLNGLGLHSGIDLDRLIEAGSFICQALDRSTQSKVALARSGNQAS